MKRTLFPIVVVALIAFVSNVLAQTQEAAKAAGQDAVKKTETKKEEPKSAMEGKSAQTKTTTSEKPKHEAKPATAGKSTQTKTTTGEKPKHEAKPAEKKAPAKTTEVKTETKKEVEKK
jgi:hypothetical protein